MPPPTYRSYIGHPDGYDLLALNQFALLTSLGLREHHRVLDLGCGSLRLGRLLIPFLQPERYCAVEPERALLEAGIEREIGWDAIRIKRPQFQSMRNFSLWRFGVRFSFVVAHSIFTHTPPRSAIHVLQQVARVLEPGGVLMATFVTDPTPRPETTADWVYPDCLPYTPDEITTLFESAGLQGRPSRFPHPCQDWWIARVASR